jgi:hypothetical protein
MGGAINTVLVTNGVRVDELCARPAVRISAQPLHERGPKVAERQDSGTKEGAYAAHR